MNILQQIVKLKKEEISKDKQQYPLPFFIDLMAKGAPPTRDFFGSLSESTCVAVIAELKFASPSRGIINQRENLVKIIQSYDTGGARAISVLTEGNFFRGEAEDIPKIKKISPLPVLRKDFIIEEYQIYQSRFLGADAVLLIASLLKTAQLRNFQEIAASLGMDCLVEVHNKEELARALEAESKIIGINNRQLEDFSVNLSTTRQLSKLVPLECLLISESGISSSKDIEQLNQSGIDAVLVGETLMTASDPQKVLEELSRVPKIKKPKRS